MHLFFMRRPVLGAFLTVIAGLCTAGGASAQSYEFPEHGFNLSIPKGMVQQPLDPLERQVMAKFTGKVEFDDEAYDREDDVIILVARIKRAPDLSGLNDKQKEKREKRADAKRRKMEKRERLIADYNDATTIEELLKARSYKNELREVEKERPMKNKAGDTFTAREVRNWSGPRVPIIRSYSLDQSSKAHGDETFAVIFIGPFVKPFDAMAAKILRTVKFTERAEIAVDAGDYEESGLRDPEYRAQVRSRLVDGWYAVDTPNFIVVTNSKRDSLIKDMAQDLEIMREVYVERFPPVEPITAVSTMRYCETYDDYMKYGAPAGSGGYWNFQQEELVLVDVSTIGKDIIKNNPNLKNVTPLGVLYHEAMHQYFYYANGHLAPASWFNEGYGEFFGGSEIDRRKGVPKRVGYNNFRMAWIKRSQRSKAWPDLQTFLQMTQRQFYGASSLQNYAFAWAFCYFLESVRKKGDKGNLLYAAVPDSYLKHLRATTERTRKALKKTVEDKEWLQAYQNDIQLEAFEKTFSGIDLVQMEKDWIKAMRSFRR